MRSAAERPVQRLNLDSDAGLDLSFTYRDEHFGYIRQARPKQCVQLKVALDGAQCLGDGKPRQPDTLRGTCHGHVTNENEVPDIAHDPGYPFFGKNFRVANFDDAAVLLLGLRA